MCHLQGNSPGSGGERSDIAALGGEALHALDGTAVAARLEEVRVTGDRGPVVVVALDHGVLVLEELALGVDRGDQHDGGADVVVGLVLEVGVDDLELLVVQLGVEAVGRVEAGALGGTSEEPPVRDLRTALQEVRQRVHVGDHVEEVRSVDQVREAVEGHGVLAVDELLDVELAEVLDLVLAVAQTLDHQHGPVLDAAAAVEGGDGLEAVGLELHVAVVALAGEEGIGDLDHRAGARIDHHLLLLVVVDLAVGVARLVLDLDEERVLVVVEAGDDLDLAVGHGALVDRERHGGVVVDGQAGHVGRVERLAAQGAHVDDGEGGDQGKGVHGVHSCSLYWVCEGAFRRSCLSCLVRVCPTGRPSLECCRRRARISTGPGG